MDKGQTDDKVGAELAPDVGLSESANDTAQSIVEFLQDMDLVEKLFAYLKGRSRDSKPEDDWDALLKEIY